MSARSPFTTQCRRCYAMIPPRSTHVCRPIRVWPLVLPRLVIALAAGVIYVLLAGVRT